MSPLDVDFARALRSSLEKVLPATSIGRIVAAMPDPARRWYRRRAASEADIFIVSAQKAGRTWVRFLLGCAIALHLNLSKAEADDLLELHRLVDHHPGIPRILPIHDDEGFVAGKRLHPIHSKRQYKSKRVVLLIRDPRDMVVSLYYHLTSRKQSFSGSIEEFLDSGFFERILRFYAIWAENLHVPDATLIARYEDLSVNAEAELRRLLAFCSFPHVSDRVIRAATKTASFESMRGLESEGALRSGRLRPGRVDEIASYKTRRGKVGGFHDELTPERIRWCDALMAQELPSIYGY